MTTAILLTRRFARDLKKLQKAHRFVGDDLRELEARLARGDVSPDSKLQGFGGRVFKARVASSDQTRGKRGGFRVMYYLVNDADEIILLTIYAKARAENIDTAAIKKLLDEL